MAISEAKKKRIIGLTVGSSVLFIVLFYYVYQSIYTPNILVGKEDTHILIPKGAVFKNVLDTLQKYNAVSNLTAFATMAKQMGYQENVKPGRYLLQANSTNVKVVRLLRSGAQSPLKISFNNVRLKQDLAEKVARNIELSEKEFLDKINDRETQKKYGFDDKNIISLFIPNTYEVYWTITGEQLFDKMKKEYDRFWNEERRAKAQKINLTPQEAAVLASIVQAETVKGDEMKRVAGVYVNRIRTGMPLQADPTVVFAVGDFSIKRVLTEHLQIDSPYNTYKYRGLPPGPINLASIQALEAVLNYEEHKFIFFCAKEDFSGYHNFAETLGQHNQNAQRYQTALTEEIRKGRAKG